MKRVARFAAERGQSDAVGASEGLGKGAQRVEVRESSKGKGLSGAAKVFVPAVPGPVPAVEKKEQPLRKVLGVIEARDNEAAVGAGQGQLLRSRAVKALLSQLVQSGTFVLSSIKREVNAEFYRQTSGRGKLEKPHGLSIGDMFDPFLCIPGDTPIDPVGHCLKIERFDEFHRKSCLGCGSKEEGDFGDCFYEQLRACITHGWDPPMHRGIG